MYKEQLEQVDRILYQLNCNPVRYSKIRSRIEQARATFRRMNKVWCSRDLKLSLRFRLLRRYVTTICRLACELLLSSTLVFNESLLESRSSLHVSFETHSTLETPTNCKNNYDLSF